MATSGSVAAQEADKCRFDNPERQVTMTSVREADEP